METSPNTSKQASKRSNLVLLFVAATAAAYTILPFIIQAFYSVPLIDDWYGASGPLSIRSFGEAWSFAIDYYLYWQGAFGGAFFGWFFSPWARYGFPALHATMLLNAILVATSFYVWIRQMIRLIVNRPFPAYSELFLLAGIFGAVTLGANNSENFSWLSSIWVYSAPMSFALLGSALEAWGVRKNRFIGIISACILFFGACGGTLVSVSFTCFLALAGLLVASVKRSGVKQTAAVFLCSLAGAILNAAAPGNYLRHAHVPIADQLGVAESIVKSATVLINEVQHLLIATPLLLFSLILFSCAVRWEFSQRMKTACRWQTLLLLAAAFPALIVIPFPIIYGSGGEIAPRAYLLLDTAIVLWLATAIVFLACRAKERHGLHFRKEERVLLLVIGICFHLAIGGIGQISQYQQSVICSQLMAGDYGRFLSARKKTILEIAESAETDVYVEQSVPTPTYICDIGLSNYPEDYHNGRVALYYGKASVISEWVSE